MTRTTLDCDLTDNPGLLPCWLLRILLDVDLRETQPLPDRLSEAHGGPYASDNIELG